MPSLGSKVYREGDTFYIKAGGTLALEGALRGMTEGTNYYVNATGGSSAYDGIAWGEPKASLAQALALAAANDIIHVAPGHTETLSGAVSFATAGVSIIGYGSGTKRPKFICNGAIDLFSVTAADVVLENLWFDEATAAATANVNVDAARCVIRGCRFELGANDLDNITVTANGDGTVIEDNEFLVTANGPDSAITVEGACDDLTVRNNYFNGGSSTNVWDDAAIDFGSTTPLNVRVVGNTFVYGLAVLSTGAAPKVMYGNDFVGARPITGASVTWYASPTVTGTKSGAAQDPTTFTDAVDRALTGDVVRLYNGVHTLTAEVALDVANVTIEPVDYRPGCRGSGAEIAVDTDDAQALAVTAAGCTVRGVRFTKGVANTTDGKAFIDVDAGGDYLSVVDCVFDLETRANADAINAATGTKGLLVDNCFFTDGAAGKTYIAWACSTLEVKNCLFDSTAAIVVCLEQLASPGDGGFIHDNLIASSGSAGGGAGSTVSWQSSPGKNVFTNNRMFGTGADEDSCGDDGDLDAWFYNCTRDGATDGTETTLNPSVS